MTKKIARQEAWREALGALPQPERIVYLLHAMDDLSYGEIAYRIGEDMAAVEARLANALKLLARALEPPD